MAIGTFGELKAAIADWAARTDIPSTTLANFVTLAETMFNYGDADAEFDPLRCRQMETTATVSVTSGEGDLPEDFLEVIKVKDPGDTTRDITYAPPDWLDQNFPTGQDGTYPNFYTIIGDSLICPIDVSLTYYAKIPTIASGADDQTNWLIVASPNAYLFGGLMQYSVWSRNTENVVYFRTLMANAVAGLQRSNISSKAGHLERRASGVAW